MNDTLFSDLARQIDPTQVAATLNHNMQALLQGVAPRLNLVSREEFEVQQALLARLRSQVDILAQQVAGLELASGIKDLAKGAAQGVVDESRADS